GLAGERAQIVVESSDGQMLASQTVALPDDGVRSTVRVPVAVDEPGTRRLRMRLVPHERERLTENNARELTVEVRDGPDRILYVEGEPRFELKFARQAVADDERLQLVALQRTAENKFLRLGVTDSLELIGGFPTTREALFGYRAVVLGSIEASYFTAAQLRLLADYVGERGGALLFLGGRQSFGEGGYAGTPLAEVMPVTFDDRRDSGEPAVAELSVTPTAAGRVHPVTQVAPTRDSSDARWPTLPPLTAVNRLRGVKPGATVLLTGGTGSDATPVLAWQRYGSGLAAALAVQDSWTWQMHADIAVDDQTHERFWRQLLRWLSSDVSPRATLLASAELVEAGGAPVALRAGVRDSGYAGVNDATVSAVIRAPSGAEQTVRMAWTGDDDGDYRGAFSPSEDGAHDVRLVADAGGDRLEARTTVVRTSDGAAEFFDAGRREPLLRRLAEESGGRYYRLDDVDALAREIMYTDSGNTVVERKELWDMPVVLLVLVGLLSAEWAYRRMRGAV
ncbi:MAG: glutamine amidotransferase, partial [Gemmatimonadaceae bacterium]